MHRALVRFRAERYPYVHRKITETEYKQRVCIRRAGFVSQQKLEMKRSELFIPEAGPERDIHGSALKRWTKHQL